MASITVWKCRCGKVYHIYIPKSIEFAARIGTAEALREGIMVDKKERQDGEIELAKNLAKEVGAEFKNVFDDNVIIRCDCGEVFTMYDILAFSPEERERNRAEYERLKKEEERLSKNNKGD